MHISEINIYPIKSLKGISLTKSVVEVRGLRHDRRLMLVDAENKFLTQREFPVMARISIDLNGEGLTASVNGGQIKIPLQPASDDCRTERIWTGSGRSA